MINTSTHAPAPTFSSSSQRNPRAALNGWIAWILFCGLLLFASALKSSGQAKDVKVQTTKEAPKEEKLFIADQLTAGLPTYKGRPGCYFKAYAFKMTAGVTYTIDLTRREGVEGLADPYLYLEDPHGTVVAKDDDSGGTLNARIVYKATMTGTFNIIATSFGQKMTGSYTLAARPGGIAVPGFIGGPGGVPAPMPVSEQVFGDITITGQPLPMSTLGFSGGNETGHGYVAYRFNVVNSSPTDSHHVTLAIPKRPNIQQGPFLRSLSRTVEVGPNATVSLALLQPDLFLNNGGTAVRIDGQEQEIQVPVNILQTRGRQSIPFYGGSVDQVLQVLTGEGLAIRLNNNVFKMAVDAPPGLLKSSGSHGGRGGAFEGKPYFYAAIHAFQEPQSRPADWDAHWLAYSSYDGMVLHAAELDGAPAPVREAVWRYVECGGSLVVLGKARLPNAWRARQEVEDGFTCSYPGFGECLVSPGDDVDKWTPRQWQRIGRAWDQTGKPWQKMQSVSEANRNFPVVDDVSIPVRGLFVLMLIFALGIGPVNLYVLTQKKRRIWLLWTVPVISLLTCLAVLGFMIVTEGWHGHVRAEGMTILDENSHRASTVGWVGYYTPVAPSDGLHFSMETELTPQVGVDRPYYGRQSSPRSLDWTDEQHLKSGWVTTRVPAHFKLRKSEGRRERVALHREKDGSLTAVNLLGADITQLWIADRDGKVYGTGQIPARGKAALSAKGQAAGTRGGLRTAYGQDWLQLYKKLTDRPNDYLLPGSYLATLGSTPFIEEGLHGAWPRNSRSVVFGIMREAADES